jgi:taurine dioxygenase
MPYETIEVKPVTAAIGAEVAGIDLGKPLGNQQFQEVHDALMAHQVLFFRDQKLTLDQHKAFGRLFGELHIHPNTPGPEGHPEILPIYADANSKRINGERWHSDVSCDPEPPMGSILNLKTVPPVGGDTVFASMYAAYDALSQPMKEYLSKLTAIHDGSMNYTRTNRLIGAEGPRTFPHAEHPVIRTHPVTGRQSIFVNPVFTHSIKDVPEGESKGILDFLYEHCARAHWHVRFRWQPDSVAFWDNRCVQHIAMWDYYPRRAPVTA